MFHIAAIFEGKRQISDFRRVFAQLQTQVPDIAMDVFDTGDIDGDDACLQECLECVKMVAPPLPLRWRASGIWGSAASAAA